MDEEQKKIERNMQRENRAVSENKNAQNAVYDENQNLVDLDDIMQGDFLVVRKLKNLTEFGVTQEQIKNIFEMTGEISLGDNIDQVLEELEKIFLLLAYKISIAPNGIVIDLATGKEDEILSRIQCNELNLDYETVRDVPEVTRIEEVFEIIAGIMAQDVKDINQDIYYNDVYSALEDLFVPESYNEIDIDIDGYREYLLNDLGFTQEQTESIIQDTNWGEVDSIQDINILMSLYDIEQRERRINFSRKRKNFRNFRT